jgi:hypothetical protein
LGGIVAALARRVARLEDGIAFYHSTAPSVPELVPGVSNYNDAAAA